ncbi:MAG: response regulator [Proteobacteria bacterium]|nr:response regulator [Pseudomonadota bacterium]MBU1695463.1 response regulator [Pseudomonadota bacterium]
MGKEQTKTLQIMLIDNDKYVRESLSTFFANGQLKFLIFKSASEGLNSLKYQDIDVVISDYFLPDMDGLTFLKQAAIQKPGIARVLMATIITDELKKEISMAGIDAFLEKPLSVASIDHILCEINCEINKEHLTKTKPEISNEK